MKLTEWFPPTVKPAHIGVYQTLTKSELKAGPPFPEWYQYWDGSSWGSSAPFVGEAALRGYRVSSVLQYVYFRGVIKE
jgi:hypothetical protein